LDITSNAGSPVDTTIISKSLNAFYDSSTFPSLLTGPASSSYTIIFNDVISWFNAFSAAVFVNYLR